MNPRGVIGFSERIWFVFPAEAGTQGNATSRLPWAPAFAGATR